MGVNPFRYSAIDSFDDTIYYTCTHLDNGCHLHESCFECGEKDCIAPTKEVIKFNKMPYSEIFADKIKQEKHRIYRDTLYAAMER